MRNTNNFQVGDLVWWYDAPYTIEAEIVEATPFNNNEGNLMFVSYKIKTRYSAERDALRVSGIDLYARPVERDTLIDHIYADIDSMKYILRKLEEERMHEVEAEEDARALAEDDPASFAHVVGTDA